MMPIKDNHSEELKDFYLSNKIASDGQKTAYYFELPHKHCSCWVCYTIWQDGIKFAEKGRFDITLNNVEMPTQ